ncbi:DUF494 family protein [Escherichia coli]
MYNALLWLENLRIIRKDWQNRCNWPLDPLSMRIYTPEECEELDASCRGFLLFLSKFRC